MIALSESVMNGQSIWDVNKKQDFPTIEDILKARDLLNQTTIRKTPLQRSDTFSKTYWNQYFPQTRISTENRLFQSSGSVC